MILIDSDREFKWFQGYVCISMYQYLELELNIEVRNWEVTIISM